MKEAQGLISSQRLELTSEVSIFHEDLGVKQVLISVHYRGSLAKARWKMR